MKDDYSFPFGLVEPFSELGNIGGTVWRHPYPLSPSRLLTEEASGTQVSGVLRLLPPHCSLMLALPCGVQCWHRCFDCNRNGCLSLHQI